ncbi:cyclopropane fatty acid synthase, partial [Burkholderia multivorans]
RQPLNAINVVIRIHWQALRLWLARVPFHGKTPAGRSAATDSPLSPVPGASPRGRSAMSDHEARP